MTTTHLTSPPAPDKTSDATSDAARTTGAPLDVIGRLYAAFGAGDLPGMLAVIHPDVDWSLQVDAPGAELVSMFQNGTGHDAVIGYFNGVANLEFHVFEPRAFHANGDVVIVELAVDFSHRKTGKRATLSEIHRFVVRDGKVVHYRPFVDTATFIETFRP